MADLPVERVNPAAPFSYVGVDYFGPFHIKERRKVLKRYGALFTCLSSRAIHIEVSNSLDTDSFLHALRRFVAGILLENGKQLDEESFHTILCEVEAIVNSRLLTFPSSDPDDLTPISPSNILTVKTKIILPPPGVFEREDLYARRRWRRVQYLANLFWSRWKKEYLLSLQQRQKWTTTKRNVAVGDVVLLEDENLPRNVWSMGRVTVTKPDAAGYVRSVVLRTSNAELHRPISKLVVLLEKDNTEGP